MFCQYWKTISQKNSKIYKLYEKEKKERKYFRTVKFQIKESQHHCKEKKTRNNQEMRCLMKNHNIHKKNI